MRTSTSSSCGRARATTRGSTFVIVLWIAFGLVSMTLYFANSMSYELRASDNRVSGIGADQAIEGAARYITSVLANQIADGSNGYTIDPSSYLNEAVPVGDAHFWIIGRDTNTTIGPGQIAFGLIDEGSKININTASSNILAGLLQSLPRASQDLPGAILDWRDTNSPGTYSTYYGTRPQPYQSKAAPFETVEELKMVYGGDMDSLVGEDANRNGILDPNENDENHDGQMEGGVLEYVTVYSREPNTRTNGAARINVQSLTPPASDFSGLLSTALGSDRANVIMNNLNLTPAAAGPGGGGGRGGGGGGQGGQVVVIQPQPFSSPLDLFVKSRMTSDEFAKIANDITFTNGTYIEGRVNVNVASEVVLASLPGLNSSPDLAQTLVNYRETNPDKLGSVAWVVDALGSNNSSVLTALQASDCITAQSYQFTADIAALGPNNRGYRRVRFVFDTSDGTPKIVYRQDLTHLGWALGKQARQTWLLAEHSR